jgi:hypothetical protein
VSLSSNATRGHSGQHPLKVQPDDPARKNAGGDK